MSTLKQMLIGLCVLTFLVMLAPGAQAGFYDQRTRATFNSAFQIPGQVLPAGTYIFEMADINLWGSRDIVQVYNADRSKLLAATIAIPKYRQTLTDKPVFTFEERGSDQPQAIKTWFYPGYNQGHEFVYGPAESHTVAAAATITSTPIAPVESAEVIPPASEAYPVVNDDAKVTEPAPEPAPEVAQAQTAPTEAPKELPKTASTMPLVALIGMLSLGGALGLKLLAARAS